jgi:glycerophosphoryl diester phosphodiesterase
VGKSFDPRFEGERIPTLRETFEFLRGTHLILHIEFKDAWLFEGIEQQVVDMIREFDYVDRVQVRAFYHPALFTVHQIDPEIAISELWYQHMPTAEETNFRTINAMADYYSAEVIADIHARGQKATAWTVNDVDIAQGLIEMGIDGLTSDYPDRLMPLVRKLTL